MTLSRQSRDYLVVQICDLHTRVTTMCRVLPLHLASDLLLSLALRLGTVCHLSWDVLLWAPPLGVVWRRSCSLELTSSLITLSSRVSCRALEGAVRPFWTAPGLTSLHCISARLVVSFSCVTFLTLSFYSFLLTFYCFIVKRLRPLLLTFYCFIVKRLRPLFVGGAIQILFDWLIDFLWRGVTF